MILYSASRADFTRDVHANRIDQQIREVLRQRAGIGVSTSEVDSWKHSLQYMNNALLDADTPEDAGVAIEYKIPPTSRRVDFILTGADSDKKSVAIIVELKQWSTVTPSRKDAIVETFIGGAVREQVHPSYQAWTYAALIRDFNTAVQDGEIQLAPCAYLHNCESGDVLKSEFYKEHTDRAPVFLRSDTLRLRDFLRRYVRYGDTSQVLYRIDHGRLKPSKNLADHLESLLHGNKEFEMIDDQKLVYECALALSDKARPDAKQVLIIEGGPGTGKSVVAVNLLVEFTRQRLMAHYVTRNAAPRAVYESKLVRSFKKSYISNLFQGAGAYINTDSNSMDALVVDEAHRLNEKSGLYQNLGENQIKEIIEATKLAVFFIDEDQRVTFKDIGDKAALRQWAQDCGATVTELELASQFRCNGSDGYLAWIDDVLQIRGTANATLQGIDYDFRVCDSPNRLKDSITQRNLAANKARLVAGYCWDWKGKKDPTVEDVVIPRHGFSMRWNLGSDGGLWIVSPESVNEVGCIHTCQGLELDYVGVIIGRDLVIRDGRVVTDAGERSSQDSSIRGYKKMLREEPARARTLAERVIKNTYRTLMTRGQKGCYLYCVDAETNAYFKQFVMSAQRNAGEAYLDRVAEPRTGSPSEEREDRD